MLKKKPRARVNQQLEGPCSHVGGIVFVDDAGDEEQLGEFMNCESSFAESEVYFDALETSS